jgi:ankyrin repeat protein
MHEAIRMNDIMAVRAIINQVDKMSSFVTPEAMALLEARNRNGLTAFALAVQLECTEIAEFFIDQYPGLDFFTKDLEGNTPLHFACKSRNIELCRKLYEIKPEKCLAPNFKGRTPFFIATQVQEFEILELF